MISILVAADPNGVIGNGQKIPWHLPEDLKLFKKRTLGSSIIMGRLTYESLPRRPLIGRVNYVVSRGPAQYTPHRNLDETLAGPIWVNSVEAAVEDAKKNQMDDGSPKPIWIIGGEQIYNLALKANLVERIVLSRVHQAAEGDKFFIVPAGWQEVERENHTGFDVIHFVKG